MTEHLSAGRLEVGILVWARSRWLTGKMYQARHDDWRMFVCIIVSRYDDWGGTVYLYVSSHPGKENIYISGPAAGCVMSHPHNGATYSRPF